MELSLETCKRLKQAGFPQDQWPQMVWHNFFGLGDPDDPEDFDLHYTTAEYVDGDEWRYYEPKPDCEWYAAPPIITADGTGGVLGWFEAQGAEIIVNSAYSPRYIMTLDKGARIVATGDTPEALVLAALDALEAKRA